MRAAAAATGGLFAALVALAVGASGCTTDAFCFADCAGETSSSGGTTTATTSGSGGNGGGGGDCGLFGCTGGGGGAGGSGGCEPTNGGVELCDKIDNDCNGQVDDIADLDLSLPQTCGTCDTNCYTILTNTDPATVTCTPPATAGQPGTCDGDCAGDYFDLDNDKTCEYYCVKSANDDSLCNNKDDDCDGVKDEDVDVCTSTTDCGKCGGNCVVLHGTPECVHTGAAACDTSNTQCQILACDCVPGDCWWDLDNSFATGCEYQCDLTNGGVEICGDGLDNDCDGKIDAADDLSGDPQIGVVCHGDPDGECNTAAHAGTSACQGTTVVCSGPNVLFQDQLAETCNGKDDDCDGAVDDSPTDAGAACGQSNVFPCSFGTFQCQGGALVCVGAVNPQTEVCNGQDDDCDGTVDSAGGNPPADSVGPCNVPVPPPAGATSPCLAGTKACIGGAVDCVGDVGPSAPVDSCGVDANCDGTLGNQPNLQTDVNHCGSCATDCYAGAVHANWGCAAGVCQFQGCQPGYYDLNNDQKCEYACIFISAQEACNGVDDDCDGQIDEGVIAPSPVQVCGVSPAAITPECTSGVTVACQNGSWSCSFPAGVCSSGCASTAEVCDSLDNNCNGVVNENVANYGKPCASDDGLPPPGHGACRTTGTYVCNGNNATVCNATKASCASLPGGCTELCDGIDNDCDGSVDETFNAKGTDPGFFVKPGVTKLAASLWMYSYEASRPTATNVAPGSGNGYRCTGAGCAGVPSAPAGVTLDKTPACSVQGKIPWFNVNPIEVEQTCQAMGGAVCTTANWQSACQATVACTWGYNPRGAACTSTYTASKFCNLGPSFDFSAGSAGDQDGLLVTGSPALQNCWGDWSALQGNVAATNKVFDVTGNLREITKSAPNTYPLMGGAFNTADVNGATCGFTFYTVDQNYKLFDTGFRCCFTANPTL